MNISDEFQKVLVFLADNRLIAAFKEVSGFTILQIELLAIRLLQALHELGQGVFGAFQQQVHMVRHEAVAVHRIIVSLPVSRQAIEIRLVVAIREKSLLPLVTLDDDMIEHSGGEKSRSAGHDASRIKTEQDGQFIEV
jgi:hypothetical protein